MKSMKSCCHTKSRTVNSIGMIRAELDPHSLRIHSLAFRTAQRAQNRRQEHVCFREVWNEQIICKPPWVSVRAAFFRKGRQNHLFAGIDASPLVKRETQHKTYTLHPSRKRERQRSIYGPASRRNVWSEERFLFSQTQIRKDLALDGL